MKPNRPMIQLSKDQIVQIRAWLTNHGFRHDPYMSISGISYKGSWERWDNPSHPIQSIGIRVQNSDMDNPMLDMLPLWCQCPEGMGNCPYDYNFPERSNVYRTASWEEMLEKLPMFAILS